MFFENKRDMKEIRGTVFSAPPAAFDPVSGYRWLPGGWRVVRVIKGELVFDNVFQANNYGYHSNYDYHPKKRSPRTFRLVVLGDSFTNNIDQPRAWPETLQELLRGRPDCGREVEVYGFPVDGGGLLNWHSVLTRQVLPDFEFDALIVADWGNDLARKFIVVHSTERETLIGSCEYAGRPRTQDDLRKLIPSMEHLYDVADPETVEKLVRRLRENADPRPVRPEEYCREWKELAALPPKGYAFSPRGFAERYGGERLALLTEMIEACRERGAQIIYCPMPSRQGLLRIGKEEVTLLHQAEARGISEHFGLHYFDGYQAFAGIDPQALVDLYWLKYDGHWAMPASAHFALKLAEWIVARRIVPPAAAGGRG